MINNFCTQHHDFSSSPAMAMSLQPWANQLWWCSLSHPPAASCGIVRPRLFGTFVHRIRRCTYGTNMIKYVYIHNINWYHNSYIHICHSNIILNISVYIILINIIYIIIIFQLLCVPLISWGLTRVPVPLPASADRIRLPLPSWWSTPQHHPGGNTRLHINSSMISFYDYEIGP